MERWRTVATVLLWGVVWCYPSQAALTFYATFNRTVASYEITDPSALTVLCGPSLSLGSSTVYLGPNLIAGEYIQPRGAWQTPGVFVPANSGIRYQASGNISPQAATIEVYSDKNLGAIPSNVSPRLFSVFFGENDYIECHAVQNALDADHIELRGRFRVDGKDLLVTKAFLRIDYPTGQRAADQNGFNHFLISYDFRESAVSKWIGMWFNGELVGLVTHDAMGNPLTGFSGDMSINQLTIGNTNGSNYSVFTSNMGLDANVDALRIHNIPVYDVYMLDQYHRFSAPGLSGAEYQTVQQPTTFLVNFNQPTDNLISACQPQIANGDVSLEIIGEPATGPDFWPCGAWGTYGLNCYKPDAGLHYAAIDNIPRNCGTIELYNNRYLPNFPLDYTYPRFFEVWWDDDYYIQVYIDSAAKTSVSFKINVRASMGADPQSKFFNSVTVINSSFPYNVAQSGNTGMNYYALSWQGASSDGVPDGWIGLWLNGKKLGKWPISRPWFWGSGNNDPDKNTFSIGVQAKYPHTTTQSSRLGGCIDGIRVSALPLTRLYPMDDADTYTPPGYLGDEFGSLPQQCDQPGTVYLFADFNRDCYVDLLDLNELAMNWLESTEE